MRSSHTGQPRRRLLLLYWKPTSQPMAASESRSAAALRPSLAHAKERADTKDILALRCSFSKLLRARGTGRPSSRHHPSLRCQQAGCCPHETWHALKRSRLGGEGVREKLLIKLYSCFYIYERRARAPHRWKDNRKVFGRHGPGGYFPPILSIQSKKPQTPLCRICKTFYIYLCGPF